MAWLALKLHLDPGAAESFSDALLEAGADSVSLDPEGALTALVGLHHNAQALIETAARASQLAVPAFSTTKIEDRDWVRESQAQFQPLSLRRLWVGPSWMAPPADARAVIRLDPGLAFGTGSHPSTRLVLRFLQDALKGGERVLDYGCGSGILAIAAAKLGAMHIDAVDIDPQAVETAQANAAANSVSVRASLTDDLSACTYDIVIANILAQPLIVLAPLLIERLAPRGRIALSGLLASHGGEVARAYATGVDLKVQAQEGDWVLLAGTAR